MTCIDTTTLSAKSSDPVIARLAEGQPASFEYDDGNVSVSLKAASGETVVLTMTGPEFIRTVHLAGKFFHAHVWDVIDDHKLV